MLTQERKRLLRRLTVALLLAALLLLGAATALARRQSVNVSGYETFGGFSCGDGVTCGVAFRGWTNEEEGVWVPFPGDQRGVVTVRIRYSGTVDFDETVQILGGYWWIAFKNGPFLFGPVDGGTVQWPVDANADLGCGDGIAVVQADLSRGRGEFNGCLFDLNPDGTVIIPPTIWGTFSTR